MIGQMDFFLIGYFLDSKSVGIYKIGFILATNAFIMSQAMDPIFKPIVAEIESDLDAVRHQYQVATRWVLLISIPISITLILAPKIYLQILFPESYLESFRALRILVIGYLINLSFGLERTLIEGRGYTRLLLINTLVAIIINIVFGALLIPDIGIEGAAIGTAAGVSILGGLGVVEMYWFEGIHPYTVSTGKVWVSGILTFTIFYNFTSLLRSPLAAFMFPISVVVCFIIFIVIMQGITEEDRRVILNIYREVSERKT
jgi:O-antigen/teichoic acid export membrane protein